MKRLLLTIACIFGMMQGQVMAQAQILNENTESLAILMKYNGGGTSQGVVNNLIFRLSSGNNTQLASTEFVLVTDQFHRVSLVSNDVLNVYYAMKDMRIQGAQTYRGFDISSFLIPNRMTVQIDRLKNGKKIDDQGFASVPLRGNPAVFADYTVQDTTAQIRQNTFKVVLRDFVFDQIHLQKFEEHADLIDTYYASAEEMDAIYNELRSINPSDIDNIQAQKQALEGLQEKILAINSRDFAKRLGLNPSFDPAKLMAKSQEVDAVSQNIETDIANTMQNMAPMYHQRGMAALQSGRVDIARADFSRALEFDNQYAPSHYQFARMDYEANKIIEAQARVEDILLNMNPDPQTRELTLRLAEGIANNYIRMGQDANKQRQFEEALQFLNAASNLTARIPELNASGVVQQQYQISYSGILQEYLANGETALAEGRLQEAESSVLKAQEFQETHQDFLPADDRIVNLHNRIMQARYARNKTHGADALRLRRFEEALGKLEDAQSLEGQFGIGRDSLLPGLISQAAKPLILQDARLGTSKAMANDLNAAREIAAKITADRKKYGLVNDTEIDEATAQMQQKIFNQECINAQTDFDSFIRSAMNKEKELDYIAAHDLYKQAQQVTVNNNQCGLSDEVARQAIARIAQAVEYQERMEALPGVIRKGDYRTAKNDFVNAGAFFGTHYLDRMGLSHPSLIDFTREISNTHFTFFIANEFEKEEQFEEAIDLTEWLVIRGYSKSQTKMLMMRIGASLAMRDHAENPAWDPKIKGMSYTKGNKKLKKIAKGYKKQWKKL